MVESTTWRAKLIRLIIYLILIVVAFVCLYPLWYTFCLSISDKSAANSGMVTFYPVGPTIISYQEIMGDWKFWNSFWISVKRTFFGTAFSLVLMTLIAYPLSKPKEEFYARNIIMWILIFCMLFNGGLIPWYMTIRNYRLIDSLLALILGGSLPIFNVIIIMNFFRAFPKDVEEAAIIDGAGPWTILLRIVLPVSLPVLATVTLFTGVYHWNEFFNGLVLMSRDTNYPLQTYIQQLVVNIPAGTSLTPEQYQRLSELSNKSLNAAKVFISMIPMLVIYPFLQRYFVSGIMLGAVKG